MEYEPAPMDLNRWLDIAVRGLCYEAQRRVRLEITGHYQDALAAAREAGQDEPAAQLAAVAALGNPEKANKHFKKVYLWNTDYERVEKYKRIFLQTPRGHKKRVVLGVTILILGCLLVKYYWSARSVTPWWNSDVIFLFFMVHFYCVISSMDFIRAHFLFSSQTRITERWFVFNAGLLITLLLFPLFSRLFIKLETESLSLPPRYAWYETGQKYLELCLCLIVWLLAIAHERKTYVPLRRKIKDFERMEKENHPEGYA